MKDTFIEFRVAAHEEDPELNLDQILALYAYSGGQERPPIDDSSTWRQACRIADMSCGRAIPVPQEASARLLTPEPLDEAAEVLPGPATAIAGESERERWAAASDVLHGWYVDLLDPAPNSGPAVGGPTESLRMSVNELRDRARTIP